MQSNLQPAFRSRQDDHSLHLNYPFVRNAWYCAAWAGEIGEPLFARRILDEPIVFYRQSNGRVAALRDICPHKFAPLHMGCRVGDLVQCGYHGLEFNAAGQCVRNPQGNGHIPTSVTVRTYPIVERDDVIWIWMGEAERADESSIPDCRHLNDPARRTIKNSRLVQANYKMPMDNLMDLGHGLFLHRNSGGIPAEMVLSEHEIKAEHNKITDMRLYRDVPPLAQFAAYIAEPRIDFWADISWSAVGVFCLISGASPAGEGRKVGTVGHIGTHLLTPETAHSTHYFYAYSRNFALADPAVDEMVRAWQHRAFAEEDGPMVEAIERLTPDVERLGLRGMVLSTDAAGVRVKTALKRLIDADG